MSSISTTDLVSFNEGETSVFGSEGNGNSRRRDAQVAIFRSGCIKDQRNSTMSRTWINVSEKFPIVPAMRLEVRSGP